jgi:hypothetical protein
VKVYLRRSRHQYIIKKSGSVLRQGPSGWPKGAPAFHLAIVEERFFKRGDGAMTRGSVREAFGGLQEERFLRGTTDELSALGLVSSDIRVVAGWRSVEFMLGAMYHGAADRDREIQPGRALQRRAARTAHFRGFRRVGPDSPGSMSRHLDDINEIVLSRASKESVPWSACL